MRRRTETLLLGALGAALAGDHPAVWRHVRAMVDDDPVISAPVAIAAERLCAQLLDGVLAAAPDFDDTGAALTRLAITVLPVVTDLLTSAALRPATVPRSPIGCAANPTWPATCCT